MRGACSCQQAKHLRPGLFADEGTDGAASIRHGSQDLGGHLDLELGQEGFQDPAFDDDPAGGGALLAREAHGPCAHQGRGPIEVGIRQHQRRVLPTHLGLEARVPGRGRLSHPGTHRSRARETQGPYPGMSQQGFANGAAATMHHIEESRRQDSLLGGTGQEIRARAGHLAGLEHHRVAEGQRWGGLPERNGQGEVPGRHQPSHSQGLPERELQSVRKLAGHHLARFPHGFPGVVAQDGHAPRRFPAGLGDGFAHLARHELGQFLQASLQHRSPAVQDIRFAGPRHFGPTRLGYPRSLDCGLHVAGLSLRNLRHHIVELGGIDARQGCSGTAGDEGATDIGLEQGHGTSREWPGGTAFRSRSRLLPGMPQLIYLCRAWPGLPGSPLRAQRV